MGGTDGAGPRPQDMMDNAEFTVAAPCAWHALRGCTRYSARSTRGGADGIACVETSRHPFRGAPM